MAQLLASIYSMLSVERNKNTTILSSAKLASFVILSVLTTSHPLYILIAILMILLKESYVIEVTKNKITEASSDFFFSHCHKYLMNQSQSWIGQQQQSLPECIYNPITAMGFSTMFTFRLDNTKK